MNNGSETISGRYGHPYGDPFADWLDDEPRAHDPLDAPDGFADIVRQIRQHGSIEPCADAGVVI